MKTLNKILGDLCNLIYPKPEGEEWALKESMPLIIFLCIICWFLSQVNLT